MTWDHKNREWRVCSNTECRHQKIFSTFSYDHFAWMNGPHHPTNTEKSRIQLSKLMSIPSLRNIIHYQSNKVLHSVSF